MKQNAGQTKRHQNANVIEAIASAMPRNAGGNSVHIADSGVDTKDKKANVFIADLPLNTSSDGTSVPGAVSSVGRAGASHASGREFETLTAHHFPSYKRFAGPDSIGFPEYFWKRVHVSNPDVCWPWKGTPRKSDGYGQMRLANKTWVASRLAFTVAYGYEPEGMLVCHTCDNRLCCNPAHLYAGTSLDNVSDMMTRGRNKSAKGTSNHFAKLNDHDIRDIRAMIRCGLANTYIAQVMGVHHSTISAIRKGKTWKHV